jgi:protein-disulfide isomerase-like protein with CxxC motif
MNSKLDYFIKNRIVGIEDHEQRMMMDCTKNMIEALIDENIEVAQSYANINQDLAASFVEYSKMNQFQLIQERIYQNGSDINEEVDEIYEEILEHLKREKT